MRGPGLVVVFFLVRTLLPSVAAAQTDPFEGLARIGVGKLWDDEGNIGTGPAIAGGMGVRIGRGFAVEGLLERQTNSREFSSVHQTRSSGLALDVRLLKYIGVSRVQPYVGASAGVGRIHTTTQFPGLPTQERRTTSSSYGGFSGVRILTGRRTFVRPEFELAIAGEHIRMGGTIGAGMAW